MSLSTGEQPKLPESVALFSRASLAKNHLTKTLPPTHHAPNSSESKLPTRRPPQAAQTLWVIAREPLIRVATDDGVSGKETSTLRHERPTVQQ